MSGRQTAYQSYRKSGLDWLGDVPAHWATGVKLLNLAESSRSSFVNGPFGSDLLANELGDEGVPVVYIRDLNVLGYRRKSSVCVTANKARELDFCRVAPGDVLVAKVGDPPGDACVYPDEAEVAIITQDVIRIRVDRSRAHPFYLACILNTAYGRAVVENISVESTRKRVSLGDFKKVRLAVPPVTEQTQIAKFLDYETAKIDALIEKKQQLIESLKEKRQAVISHAVTKGLNPDAPMRDSGVEWLGKVPAHWEVLSLRRVLNNIEQGTSPLAANTPPEEGECGVLKLSAIKQGEFIEAEAKTLDVTTPIEEAFKIRKGDFLVTRGNTPDLVADACVVKRSPRAALMMSDLVYRLNTNSRVSTEYLCLCLLSSPGRAQIKIDARGSSMSMAKVSQGHIRAWRAAIPSSDEQATIVAAVEEKCASIGKLLDACDRQTELLQERRTALISAAVTGKIDVRGWKPPASDAAAKVA